MWPNYLFILIQGKREENLNLPNQIKKPPRGDFFKHDRFFGFGEISARKKREEPTALKRPEEETKQPGGIRLPGEADVNLHGCAHSYVGRIYCIFVVANARASFSTHPPFFIRPPPRQRKYTLCLDGMTTLYPAFASVYLL